MKYLHYKFDAGPQDIIEVTLDKQANVLLLDPSNFRKYKNGQNYRYSGGLAKTSPVRLSPPRPGHWHVVVNLGGYRGTVRAGARLIKG